MSVCITWGKLLRHIQHRLIHIEADERAGHASSLGHSPSHQPGTTPHVEHPLANLKRRGLDQVMCPCAHKRGNDLPLIRLRRIATELPSRLLTYTFLRS